MDEVEEIRCPVDQRKMFAKIRWGDDAVVLPGNVIEVACPYCRRMERDKGRSVGLVLHSYNMLGEYLSTEYM